jgi:hypothetical protein
MSPSRDWCRCCWSCRARRGARRRRRRRGRCSRRSRLSCLESCEFEVRLAGSLGARSGREIPARRSTFQTVECAKPVRAETSRGPQPVSRRQAQIRSCSSAASSRGLWCGRLERSSRQPRLERACSLASRQRCHQRMRRRRRDAEGRRGGPSLGRKSWQTHSLKGGPDVLSAVHNVCGHDS